MAWKIEIKSIKTKKKNMTLPKDTDDWAGQLEQIGNHHREQEPSNHR